MTEVGVKRNWLQGRKSWGGVEGVTHPPKDQNQQFYRAKLSYSSGKKTSRCFEENLKFWVKHKNL